MGNDRLPEPRGGRGHRAWGHNRKVRTSGVAVGSKEVRHKLTLKRSVQIQDARQLTVPPTLEQNGVALLPFVSKVSDYRDDEEVGRTLYPEAIEFLKGVFGAEFAAVRLHIVRSEDPAREA